MVKPSSRGERVERSASHNRRQLKQLADSAETRARSGYQGRAHRADRSADPARHVAFEVLQAVTHQDAYANLLLPSRIRRRRLSSRDSRLATELVYGTLRAQGTYDAIIAACTDRSLAQLDPDVLNFLRLGAHQLLALRIPAHAAVYQMVGLSRATLGPKPSAFVNAVMRAMSQKTRHEWLQDLTAELEEPTARAALTFWHPEWIVRAFRQSLVAHGRAVDDIEALLHANNEPAPVHVVALPGVGSHGTFEELGTTGVKVEPSTLVTGAGICQGGNPYDITGMREGQVRVQDIGSQLVTRALVAAPLGPAGAEDPVPRPDGREEAWLDLCAGPGGKAALLAALAAQHPATLLANESAPHRVKLVREALAPLPQHAWSVRQGDGRDLETGQSFDRVLIDAPCTGLGALRRRPESRWRRQPGDVAELSQRQRELLHAGFQVLAAGGVLAYVTCSPHVAETTAVAGDFLAQHTSAQLLDTGALLDAVALTPLQAAQPWQPSGRARRQAEHRQQGQQTPASTAQLWPHVHGTDAMFLALIRKNPASAPIGSLATGAARH